MRNTQRILTANIVGLCGFVFLIMIFAVCAMLRMEHPEYALIPLPIPYVIGWIWSDKIDEWLDN
jgi:hypothetical protein